ncbi:MAG: methylenetetrahydrofolate reductase [Acidimicrobiales bacterium]
MRVDSLLAAGHTRSFEFFPPKSDDESATLAATLAALEPLAPSFVSVTYRGGRESRQRTFDLVTRIQRTGRLTVMAHVVCVDHTVAELREILTRYRDAGVENLMVLGGDATGASGVSEVVHAIDLVRIARGAGEFSVGVAAHPQVHPRSPDRASDRRRLADKLSEADFAITQFFFDANEWSDLVGELSELGVTRPVVPGIMPVTTLAGVERMAAMGGPVPDHLVARLAAASRFGPLAVRAEGVAAATELCRDLIDRGAPGLHFYTLNRSTATREVHAALYGDDAPESVD